MRRLPDDFWTEPARRFPTAYERSQEREQRQRRTKVAGWVAMALLVAVGALWGILWIVTHL
jgi:hypothetical protein